jgi:hypothetical protein
MLQLIEEERRRYEQHPFIQFLLDESVPGDARLSYAPFAAHFVLTFADINRYLLRGDASAHPLQPAINRHSEEDAQHWAWYLTDLETLGWNPPCTFTGAMRFLFREEGRRARELGYHMAGHIISAPPTLRMALIEAIEAMGNVWLTATLAAARASSKYERLIYLADHHMERETGHAIGSRTDDTARIEIPDELRPRGEEAIRDLFARMSAFNSEILAHTRAGLEAGPTARFALG